MAGNEERLRVIRLRQAQERSRGGSGNRPRGSLAPTGINEGIARGIDGMAGPLNRGVNAVLGTNLSESPTADLMDATGVRRLGRDPDGLGEQALVGAGEAAAYLVPFTGAMRAAQGATRAGSVARGVTETLRQPFVAAPASAIGAEMAAGAGMRVAGEVASRHSDNALVRPVAEVAGGLAAGMTAYGAGRAVNALANFAPVVQTGRAISAAAAPFSRTGARKIAEDSVRSVSSDPDAAADALLRGENIGRLTPAQQTGEEGLMALERGLMARDPNLRRQVTEGVDRSRSELRAAAYGDAEGFSATDTRQFFQERMARHEKVLDGYVRRAGERADAALRRIEPRRRPDAASEAVRREIDLAFEQARKQEAALWARVPREVEIPTAQARAALRAALDETGPVSADRVPSKARAFLGDGDNALGDTASMRDLHRLYSEMRQAGREAMARPVPDEFSARQANGIAEAILRDIEGTAAMGPAAERLADARAFSRVMSERFGQGNVARTTAVQRSGGDRVSSELTLERTVGQGGTAGAVAVDDIRRAVGTGAAEPPLTDYVRDLFTSKAARRGRVDVNRADDFMRDNAALIDRFPDSFQPEALNAIAAARTADRVAARAQEAVKALGDPRASAQVGFANAAKGREVARSIFEADNPAAAARAIARAANKDQTGDAVLGLQAGVVDEVIRRASTGRNLTGRALADELANPDVQKVIRAVLPPAQQSRLRIVAVQLRKLDAFDRVTPDDIDSAPNMLVATFMQIQAAKAGRSLGTGTIQVPGMFVRRSREIMKRLAVDHADALIREAITDNPKLLAALLTGPGSSRVQIRQAEQRLTAWAVGALAASGEDQPQE